MITKVFNSKKQSEVEFDFMNPSLWILEDGRLTNHKYRDQKLSLEKETFTDPSGGKITDFQVSKKHMVVLNDKGEVFGLGENKYGRMTGKTPYHKTLTKLELPNNDKVKKILVDPNNTYALTEQGEIYATGSNDSWQLAIKRSSEIYKWNAIPHPEGMAFTDVFNENKRFIAKGTDKNVYGWGYPQISSMNLANALNEEGGRRPDIVVIGTNTITTRSLEYHIENAGDRAVPLIDGTNIIPGEMVVTPSAIFRKGKWGQGYTEKRIPNISDIDARIDRLLFYNTLNHNGEKQAHYGVYESSGISTPTELTFDKTIADNIAYATDFKKEMSGKPIRFLATSDSGGETRAHHQLITEVDDQLFVFTLGRSAKIAFNPQATLHLAAARGNLFSGPESLVNMAMSEGCK